MEISYLFPFFFTFHQGNIAIDRQIRVTLNPRAWFRPLHLEPVQLVSLAYAKDYSGIVRGEIAASANLHGVALQISRLPCDASANCVAVAGFSSQAYAQPVRSSAALFFRSTGAASLLEISTSTAPSLLKSPSARPGPTSRARKKRSAFMADVRQSGSIVME